MFDLCKCAECACKVKEHSEFDILCWHLIEGLGVFLLYALVVFLIIWLVVGYVKEMRDS